MKTKIKVFYDGNCPICSREIKFYQRQRGAEEIIWVDIFKASDKDFPDDLSIENAAKRFYVLGSDGSLSSGGDGFVLLWLALPKFYLLGKIFNNKFMGTILEFSYKFFVINRTWMQRLFIKLT